jgi:hypothetical protein
MPWPVHPNGLLGGSGSDNDTYKIERSLRFNSGDTAYLNRTLTTPTNNKIFTYSCWVKSNGSTARQPIFVAINGGATLIFAIELAVTTQTLLLWDSNYSSGGPALVTSQVFRDPSAWYHIVLSVDTTQATAANRTRLYVNGSQITAFSSANYAAQNSSPYMNSAVSHSIGSWLPGVAAYASLYMTELNFIDGEALTPSSFGETDAITGRWKAKAYSGTYGNNGFYLKFADNSGTTATTLGKDSSPNGNNWTPNNFSVTAGAGNDSLVDSPTNYGSDTGVGGEVRGNYCTINPLKNFGITLTNGNLDGASNTSTRAAIYGTIGVSSGKWYWEVTQNSVSGVNALSIGIANENGTITDGAGATSNEWIYYGSGQKVTNNILTAYGASFTTGDIIGVAFNADAGTLVFYKNNTSQGTAFTGLTSGPYFPAIGDGGNSNAQSWTANFGQRPFAYTAPTGFKALCTTNLPTPTINKPSNYMDAVTYTGTGATQTISVPGFTPDLVWIKSRGAATNHRLYDTTRGTNYLVSNSTAAEVGSGTFAFSGNGFIVSTDSDINSSGTQYVSWAWDAGSSSVTNTSGSISSTVRANPQAGVSVVSFVNASGTNQSTVGHGLGSSPKMIIAKNRDTGANNWAVFHSSVCDTTSKFLQLNTTSALATFATVWGASLPSSSVFGVTGGGIAAASVNMIAYCFAEVEGFSKIGSYVGNGSTDGPFVYCGFRPRFIMVKRIDSAEPWIIKDTARSIYNGYDVEIYPNLSNAEGGPYSPPIMDYLSNGFKLRSVATASNGSGGTFIFIAFAESPFKYARAR